MVRVGERVRMSKEIDLDGMSLSRWRKLMNDDAKILTLEEKSKGWHFCNDWDGLLINAGDEKEGGCCYCFTEEEKANFRKA
jgi:hypothetical protein